LELKGQGHIIQHPAFGAAVEFSFLVLLVGGSGLMAPSAQKGYIVPKI